MDCYFTDEEFEPQREQVICDSFRVFHSLHFLHPMLDTLCQGLGMLLREDDGKRAADK